MKAEGHVPPSYMQVNNPPSRVSFSQQVYISNARRSGHNPRTLWETIGEEFEVIIIN